MTVSGLHTLVQLLALAALLVGLYMLAGLPWALLVGGGGVFIVSLSAEASRPRVIAPGGE